MFALGTVLEVTVVITECPPKKVSVIWPSTNTRNSKLVEATTPGRGGVRSLRAPRTESEAGTSANPLTEALAVAPGALAWVPDWYESEVNSYPNVSS